MLVERTLAMLLKMSCAHRSPEDFMEMRILIWYIWGLRFSIFTNLPSIADVAGPGPHLSNKSLEGLRRKW